MKVFVTLGPVSSNRVDDLLALGTLEFRLTFSFGNAEMQLNRANKIRKIAEAHKQDCTIWGALSGTSDRVGRIFKNGAEETLLVRKNQRVEVVDSNSVELENSTALPVPGICAKRLIQGDTFIYGHNHCEFKIEQITSNGCVAVPQSSAEIIGTRSLHFTNKQTESIELDDNTNFQIKTISENPKLFDGLIIPDVYTSKKVSSTKRLLGGNQTSIKIGSTVERKIDLETFGEILTKSDYVFLDRSKISLNEGYLSMPSIVASYLKFAGDSKPKIIIASHISSTVSQGRQPQLSSAELSDFWTMKTIGIGGVLLTEETAIDADFILSVESILDLAQAPLNS